MKILRFIVSIAALVLIMPFIIIGMVIGPMKLGFEVGLELWQGFEDNAYLRYRRGKDR